MTFGHTYLIFFFQKRKCLMISWGLYWAVTGSLGLCNSSILEKWTSLHYWCNICWVFFFFVANICFGGRRQVFNSLYKLLDGSFGWLNMAPLRNLNQSNLLSLKLHYKAKLEGKWAQVVGTLMVHRRLFASLILGDKSSPQPHHWSPVSWVKCLCLFFSYGQTIYF